MANYQSSSRQTYIYTKNQLRLSSIAYLTTGIGLLATFLIAFLISFFFKNTETNSSLALSLQYVSIIFLIISFVLSIIWSFRVSTASMFFRITTISLYCISNGIGFGSLFAFLNQSEIVGAFAITSAVCGLCFLISRFLSLKAALNLQKLIFIMFGIYFIIAIITFFTWMFGFHSNLLGIALAVLIPILLLAAITYQMWLINKMDEFISDRDQSIAFGIFLGFSLLMMIIQIMWQVFLLLRWLR
ncbi:MAG: hypothetical protein ACRCW6_02310 [Mycoplasmoidaceae bacterium]